MGKDKIREDLYTMLLTRGISLPELYIEEKVLREGFEMKYNALVYMIKVQGCDRTNQKIAELITSQTIH
jgi:hypothetical protein